jgi:ribosomal-protein-alanine N-acetyltransferase
LGFDVLGLHRVWAGCDSQNTASAHVLEKIGMSREGCMREDVRVRGEWRDTLLFGILENEYKARLSE